MTWIPCCSHFPTVYMVALSANIWLLNLRVGLATRCINSYRHITQDQSWIQEMWSIIPQSRNAQWKVKVVLINLIWSVQQLSTF